MGAIQILQKAYLRNGIGDNYCFEASIVDPKVNQSENK